MDELADALRAVLVLAFGGFLFMVVGESISSSATSGPMIDLQVWGLIYIIGAIVLALVVVGGTAATILR